MALGIKSPCDGLYGEALPEQGTFFRIQVYMYERVGISLVKVYKRVGKSVIWVCKRARKGQTMNFMPLKSQENVIFLWLIPI